MRGLLIVLLCFSVSACMVGPNFHTPVEPQTNRYTRLPLPKKTKAQYFAAGQDIPAEWWKLFHSKTVNSLIFEGLTHSPNLQAAQAALRQANENWRGEIGNLLLPGVNGQLVNGRQQGLSFLPGVGLQRFRFSLLGGQANVNYLLDIFGGSRRQLESLKAQVDYEQFLLEGTFLTLTSNIVTTIVDAASFQAQIKATQELIVLQEKTLKIVVQQLHVGGASGADVLTQETQLAQTKALLPPLMLSLARSRDALAALVGEYPSELQIPNLRLSSLHLPKRLPVSLPSSLVHQRPDIRAQEALLHSASAQIGVATANLLPQITLQAYIGQNSNNLSTIFNSTSTIWSISSGLLQPIFHGGYLLAQRRAAIDAYDQALGIYKQTVLQAFQNVADSLEAVKNDSDAFDANKKAEIAALRTMNLTEKQFRLGAVSYLLLLNAQRQYQQTKVNRIQSEAARLSDTAALFQALGGGWWNRDLTLPKPKLTENQA